MSKETNVGNASTANATNGTGAASAARSSHPLVALLREIRERHPEVTLTEIEACMGIPFDTLRHIEKGRRPLPGLQDGLGRWILHLLDCVRATPEERAMVETLLSRVILMEWSEELGELGDK